MGGNSDEAKGWAVTCAAMAVNTIQAGTMYMVPNAMMPLVLESLGIPMGYAPVPIAVEKISFVVWVLVVGNLVDKFRPKLCIVSGLFIMALFAGLYPFLAVNFATLCALHFCVALGGALASIPVIAILLAGWFQDAQFAVALGLVQAAFSLSGIVLPPVMAIIASSTSWRVSWALLSAVLFSIGLLSQHMIEDGENGPACGDLAAETEEFVAMRQSELKTEESNSLHGMMLFVCMSLLYFGVQYSFGAFQDNLIAYLTTMKISISEASGFFSAFCFAIFAGTLVAGRLVDRYSPLTLIGAGSVLSAVGIAMAYVPGPLSVTTFVLAILHGAGYGVANNSLYVMVPEHFEPEIQGRVQSFFFAIGVFGNAFGAALTGTLTEQTGSYGFGFGLALFIAVASLGTAVGLQFTLEDQDVDDFDIEVLPTRSKSMRDASTSILRGGVPMSWMVDSGALSSSFIPATSFRRVDLEDGKDFPAGKSMPAFYGPQSMALNVPTPGQYAKSSKSAADSLRKQVSYAPSPLAAGRAMSAAAVRRRQSYGATS